MVRAGLRLRVLPQTRGDCPGTRPCPYLTCRYHLLVDVGRDGRLLKAREFDENDEDSLVDALRDMDDTCALDVAARGGVTLDAVGELLGIAHQVVDRVQERALEEIRMGGHDFEEREHPEDFYIRYSNMGADDLAEITAELRARGRTKR